MSRRRAAGFAKLPVGVVDPPVIDEITLRIEDRGFRSHLCAALLHQGMLHIAQSWQLVVEFLQVRTNASRRFVFVGKDQPESGLASIFHAHFLKQRRIPIRNRTIRSNEKQHNYLAGSFFERILGRATEVASLLPRSHRKNKTQKKHRRANRYPQPKAAPENVRIRIKENPRTT
jgi:hypothetical protein